MKKFITITLIAIIALTSVFAGEWKGYYKLDMFGDATKEVLLKYTGSASVSSDSELFIAQASLYIDAGRIHMCNTAAGASWATWKIYTKDTNGITKNYSAYYDWSSKSVATEGVVSELLYSLCEGCKISVVATYGEITCVASFGEMVLDRDWTFSQVDVWENRLESAISITEYFNDGTAITRTLEPGAFYYYDRDHVVERAIIETDWGTYEAKNVKQNIAASRSKITGEVYVWPADLISK